ncbi:hypothetical protein O181_080697 [Austropuccinia psidii MF-1]|uniref:Uncharacterized protein n=1 Tax=Austropuccinia psidii MF-1 TaxID=1389203 RepID=A0A9Q3FM42_9BASI|nr:hypothetical protein [Austropuccinia psidii MF-1]
MNPTRSGINYSIQPNGSGPGHPSHKSKRQECQPRGEAQMEDCRASTTAIPVFRSAPIPTGKSGNIPVSVQELVYGGKTAGVGTFSKILDKDNEFLSSSKESLGPRKERGLSEGLYTHFLQRTSPKEKILAD